MSILRNIAQNTVRRRNFSLIAEKLLRRVAEPRSKRLRSHSWCADRAESWSDFARGLEPALWEETESVCHAIEREARSKLNTIDIQLGGAGNYPLLYFLTRFLKPQVVVETGVAAGWSSQTLLTALRKNMQGHLYSSDFPYFRLENPEQYIGYVVDDHLKDQWTLLIDGDRYNLPVIMRQVQFVDLFHYDSDKSYGGRLFAWDSVSPKLSPRAVVLFDDIQDNFHFRDLTSAGDASVHVFGFEGKYVGLIAPHGSLIDSVGRCGPDSSNSYK